MWTIIVLVVIMCLCIVNMILLMDFNDIPQHNAMDKYNDINKRLEALEQRFNYHIQSTDELKPKA